MMRERNPKVPRAWPILMNFLVLITLGVMAWGIIIMGQHFTLKGHPGMDAYATQIRTDVDTLKARVDELEARLDSEEETPEER